MEDIELSGSSIAVVDIDDTLLVSPKVSYFFWWLSLVFQRIGRRLQRANSALISGLNNYERVIVLTGRDARENQFTMDQLRRAGIRFTTLVCCPRKRLIDQWKISVVETYGKQGSVVWIDDLFAEGVPEALRSSIANIVPQGPGSVARATVQKDGQLGSELSGCKDSLGA